MAVFESKKKGHSHCRTVSKCIIEIAFRARTGIAIAHVNVEQSAYHKRFDTTFRIDHC